jgi:aspartyl-tRNA(Asn)/glutamyl-tRNA(Gln) amidotransferase subunit C
MTIKKETIKYVADLARMALHPDEEILFSTQLNDILDYMEKINELDTDNIKPMSYAVSMGNVLREDLPRQPLSNEQALSNAPDKKENFFRVPKIIE